MTTRVLADRGKVDAELKGNTLRVYVYAMKRSRVGVREVQRALGLSNPSLAQYHLNKLKELGLVKEDNGEYEIVGEVKVDVMRNFLRIGTSLIPRFVFYAVFFTIVAAYTAWLSVGDYSNAPFAWWFTLFLLLACIAFWFEAVRAWRAVPQP